LTEKWGVGSRQDQEPLTFFTVPGRRVPLPETTTGSDYFNSSVLFLMHKCFAIF
jgi:hypothetical protein